MTEEPAAATPDPAPDALVVTVLRSGGVAGMVRRWSAEIPDDGTPAARAARRIAVLGEDAASGPVRDLRPGRVRDGFQWTLTSGGGSLRCDEAGRRQDSEVDELIHRVTASHATGAPPGRPRPRVDGGQERPVSADDD